MLTLKVSRHLASVQLDTSQKCSPSKYPETWCLWSSIRVKMLTLKVFRHLASVQLDTSQNAHPQSILKLGVCTARYKSNAQPQSIPTLGVCGARYESKCSPSKYLETWRLYSSIQVKMLNLKVSRHLASVELDTSQNAHPQSISTLGVCTARYESKCSPSKYLETWRLWSSIRVKMLTLKVFRHESKYPDTRRLWSSIRVKMLTLKVSRHLASVQLDTSQMLTLKVS